MANPGNALNNSNNISGIRRYYRYFLNASDANYESSYDDAKHFKRFKRRNESSVTINYTIYFYIGDTKRSDGGEVTVNQYFENRGINTTDKVNKTSFSSYGKTKEEIAVGIKEVLDEITNLGFGLTFTCNTFNNLTDGNIVSGGGGTYHYQEDTLGSWDKYNAGIHSIVIFGRWSNPDDDSAAWLTSQGYEPMRMTGRMNYVNKDARSYGGGGCRHEMEHVLNISHVGDAKPTGTNGNYIYGNTQLSYAPMRSGFIAKEATGAWREDNVCTADFIFSKSGTTNIFGQLTSSNDGYHVNNTKITPQNISYGVYPLNHPDEGWPFHAYGRCRAFMFDEYKKELMYEVPIDYLGYFCFPVRVLPPSSIKLGILLASKEFHYSYINGYSNNYVVNNYADRMVYIIYKSKYRYYKCILEHIATSNNKPDPDKSDQTEIGKVWTYFDEKTSHVYASIKEWKTQPYKAVPSETIAQPENGKIFWRLFYIAQSTLTIGSNNNLNTLLGTSQIRILKDGYSGSLSNMESVTGLNLVYSNNYKETYNSDTNVIRNDHRTHSF